MSYSTYSTFVVRLGALALGALVAVALTGCGGLDRGAYVEANERLFKELPSFPGARLESEMSTAYRSTEDGPVVGYGTRFDLSLPPSAAAASVGSFFRQRLLPAWRLVETHSGPVLNFRRGKAFVSINLESAHVLEVAVDHLYFGKAGH
jgi:hypothetical protein